MSLIKEKIIQSAIRLFAEKGYQATSIQDIAEDCSIAKGSLYKYFDSKEDLYICILEQRQQSMIKAVEKIRQRTDLSRKETFLEEIAYQFEFFLEHGYYTSRDHHDLPLDHPDKISLLLRQIRFNMLLYYQDLLTRNYGAIIQRWHWDLAVMFSAIIKEYTFYLLDGPKSVAKKELASFIAGRMDDLVQGLEKRLPGPLLTGDHVGRGMYIDTEENSFKKKKAALFEGMLTAIPEIPVPNLRKKELHEAAVMLRDELLKDSPRGFLVRALLNDLSTERELSLYSSQLQHMFRSISSLAERQP
ncbi:TetR/AcrR family transcriptional regulator [Paenibacillus sp. GbtcB18]|uniref:TetR/AcrR family transcriptional regulator n=1 Tax=Paenibacillus sp. GbtcB18 TaxID=2824763 RepID=UPI001C309060|nr:TetR/AcrR family transcriptional regulator [Paenibacillus sp. GbtcB18]